MKRIDITGSIRYKLMDKLSIKPSVKEVVINNLHHNDVWKIRDLCLMTEEEALNLFLNDKGLLSHVRTYLVSVGLHFGMTEDILTDYMDADFLEKEKQEKLKKYESKKENVKDDDANSYILVSKRDWEETKAKASNDLSIDTLIKEIKKEIINPIKHFFIFLLIISLPAYGLYFYLRETFEGSSLEPERSCNYESIRSKYQPNTFDLDKRIEEIREKELDLDK